MSEQEVEVAEKVEVETPEEIAPETAEVAKFSKEDVDGMLEEKTKRIVDLESQVKGIRKLQSEATQELNRFKAQPQSSVNTQAIKLLIDEMESQPVREEYGEVKPSPRLTQLKAEIKRLEQKDAYDQYQARQQASIDAKTAEIRQKAEDAGLDPDGEEFDTVINALSQGQYKEVDRRLDRILAKKETKVGKTEEEIRAEAKEEGKQEILAKYKVQDTGSPSGVNQSFEETEKKYSEGEIGYEEYATARKGAKID